MGADVIRFDPIGGWPRLPPLAGHRRQREHLLGRHEQGASAPSRSTCARRRGASWSPRSSRRRGPEAGIFLTNLQVGDWLSYETLSARRADLIMLRIIGNPDGTVAVDYTVNARMGWPFVTGAGGPRRAGQQRAARLGPDLRAHRRHRPARGRAPPQPHGRGGRRYASASPTSPTTSLARSGTSATSRSTGAERPRIGNDMYGTFGGDFATRDGRRVMLVVVTPRHVKGAGTGDRARGRVQGRSRRNTASTSPTKPTAGAVRDELRAALAPWFAGHGLEEVGARLTEAGVLWGPFRTHTQMVEEDPFCSTANPLFQRVDQPGDRGPCSRRGSPLDFAAAPRGAGRAGAAARPAYRRNTRGGAGSRRRHHRRPARARHRHRAGLGTGLRRPRPAPRRQPPADRQATRSRRARPRCRRTRPP